jgi:C4-dicarboxylate-specific signal transduction histidine kinase
MTWPEESEAIVRGLAHALSNRVVALGMAGESLDDPEDAVRAEARAQVRGEAERLAEVTRLLKLLPREGLGRPQALQISEVLSDALALQAHHLELRDLAVSTAVSATVLPVRVERWALLRALVLLIGEARRVARERADAAAPVVLTVDGTEDECWVVASAKGARPGVELAALAAEMGGRMADSPDEIGLVLPSLAAVRRREGR